MNTNIISAPTSQWNLTFQWNEAGTEKIKQISEKQTYKNNGSIIIGRDPNRCDVVLKNPTVSAVHVEIYFNSQQQRFFIKHLRAKNPTFVDGQELIQSQELSLNENSILLLGEQELKVTAVFSNNLEETIISRLQNKKVISCTNSSDFNPNQNLDDKTKSWLDRAIVPAIATILVGIISAGITWHTANTTAKIEKQKVDSQVKIEQTKLDFETKKIYRQLLADKQKFYEEKFYQHKNQILSLLKENTNGYNKLRLKNNCSESVKIAASFTALNDVSETRGWNVIAPYKELPPVYYTKESGIYLYAYITKNNKTIAWQGKDFIKKHTMTNDFNYLADNFFAPKQEQKSYEFYLVNFDSHRSYGETTKTFTCNENSLQLN